MAFAVAAADLPIDVEIVAVDAMQVYRGMDIGTAKPTAEDRRNVTHHCLDLVDPTVDFTLVDFVRAAGPAIDGIRERGAVPLLVAGTGLYLRAVTDPMAIPGNWPDVRATLEERAVRDGAETLHAELVALDPVAGSRMEPGNTRRVVRALEVTIGSGRPFSSFGPGLATYPETEFRMVGLRWPRPALQERIAQRVHAMVAAGLVEEVASLLRTHGALSRTARQALGYKEVIDHLDGNCTLAAATTTIITRTMQFAVRQERWFRRDPRVTWIEVEDNAVAEALPVLRDCLQR